MALDKDRLGTNLKDRIKSDFGVVFSGLDETKFENLMKAIADEILKEFTTYAVVNTNVSVASVTGVTVGVASSGPGSGTGTGTIS